MGTGYIRFRWDKKLQKFTRPVSLKIQVTEPQKKIITELIEEVQTKSGIRSDPICLGILFFVFVNIIGYTLGAIGIYMGYDIWAGIIMILSPLISFFIVIGPFIIKES